MNGTQDGPPLASVCRPLRLPRRIRVQRVGLAAVGRGKPRWVIAAGLFFVAAIGATAWLVNSALLDAEFVKDRVLQALSERLGPAHSINLDRAFVATGMTETRVVLEGLGVQADDGSAHVLVRRAEIDVDRSALMRLKVAPEAIRLDQVDIRLARAVTPPASGLTTESRIRAGLIELGGMIAGLQAVQLELGGGQPTLEIEEFSIAIDGSPALPNASGSPFRLRAEMDRDGGLVAKLSRAGGSGAAATLNVSLSSPGAGQRRLKVSSDGLLLGHLLPARHGVIWASGPDLAVNLSAEAEVTGEGRLGDFRLAFDLGPGRLVSADRDLPPIDVEQVRAQLSWTDAAKPIQIDQFDVAASGVMLALVGSLTAPGADDATWLLSLAARDATMPRPGSKGGTVKIAGLEGLMRFDPAQETFFIDRLSAKAGGGQAELVGQLRLGDAPSLAVRLDAAALPAREAFALWPVNVAPPVRSWLAENLGGGRLDALRMRLNLNGDDLMAAINKRPLTDASTDLTFAVSDFALAVADGMGPVQGVSIQGKITGRTAEVTTPLARLTVPGGTGIEIAEVRFAVADTAQKPPEGQLNARVGVALGDILAFFRQPGVADFSPLDADDVDIRGRFQGTLQIAWPLTDAPKPADVRTRVQGNLRDVGSNSLIKGETLENGQFTVSGERDGLAIQGEAKLSGIPALIDLQPVGRGRSEATVRMNLDENQLAKRGLALGSALGGAVALKLTSTVGGREDAPIGAEVDLIKTRLETGLPGLSKRPGQPGRLRFTLARGRDEIVLSDARLELGSTQITGRLAFSPDGEVRRASLGTVKFSPGDNARADIERVGKGLKVTIRGNAFDARPFLKGLQTGNLDNSKSTDLEIDLKTTVLSGFGGELISGAELKVERRGGDLKAFEMTGRFDGSPITVTTQSGPRGQAQITFVTADGGALLRFFDYYQKMIGGRIVLTAEINRERLDAELQVRDFVLRNEAALSRFATSSGAATRDGRATGAENADIAFTKLKANFRRVPGRITVREAVMWGPQVGGSIDGTLDYAKDRVGLNGTLVPAYALNNLFSQVPLLGPILGGGENEGLFAVSFAISGKASEPVLSVNPLSAIAPGFLRKLVDFGRATDPGAPPTSFAAPSGEGLTNR